MRVLEIRGQNQDWKSSVRLHSVEIYEFYRLSVKLITANLEPQKMTILAISGTLNLHFGK